MSLKKFAWMSKQISNGQWLMWSSLYEEEGFAAFAGPGYNTHTKLENITSQMLNQARESQVFLYEAHMSDKLRGLT